MAGLQRCLGVDGEQCGELTDRRRCPAHARVIEARRTRAKRSVRPYTYAERQRREAAVRAWVAEHGWLCPGWRRPPHGVTVGDLTADHPQSVASGGDEGQSLDVLCRSCNSSKQHRA